MFILTTPLLYYIIEILNRNYRKEFAMKKKILACLLSLTLILSGCNNNNEGGNVENSSPATDENNAENNTSSVNYEFTQLKMGGGGFVSGLIAHPTAENVIYARTDVGGAYRWNADTKSWECMSFNISADDVGLLSIDGIALDKNHPERVYMAAGCSYFSNAKSAILISDDYGKTFTQVDVSDIVKFHGNGMGRQNGERIAVDPNNSDIIYVGGRTGGLIVSKDAGKTWERVESVKTRTTSNGVGINSIVFDETSVKDGVTQRIFFSVSESGSENVFVSEDGGATWNAIAGLNTEYMPQRMHLDASNGILYIVYADGEGPHSHNSANGAILKYSISDKSVTDITPENHLFGDIAVDPTNPSRLVAVTIDTWTEQPNGSYGDIFYTSTDGGATWKNVNTTMTMDNNGIEWVKSYAIHWCGSLMLNPSNTNQLMVVSGNGIFACDNIWDDAPAFYFNAKGVEETVALDIMSIPNGPLVTAIGDYDGMVYTDTSDYGTLHTTAIGSTEAIAYGGENNEIWAKVGADQANVLISNDSGANWNNIKPPTTKGGGKITISPDGNGIVWSPSEGGNSYYSTDRGESWEKCTGIASNYYVCFDTVNNNYVYATGGGMFLVSSDGGKTFKDTYVSMSNAKRFAQPYGIEGKIILALGSSVAISTDHGESFEVIKTVKDCEAVGVGKSSDDGKPYVIYIWGEVGELGEGVYSSEDEGQTWTKLTDEQHQFGGTGNGAFLIGDYNEYGTFYMSTVGLGVIKGALVK